MSTEFTDSKGNHVLTRTREKDGIVLNLVVDWQEFEQNVWLVSETGKLESRLDLIASAVTIKLKAHQKINLDKLFAELDK